MPFQILAPGTVKSGDPVTVSLTRRGKGKTMIFISLSAHLAKCMGWKRGDRMEIAVGSGPETGQVRIRLAHGTKGYRLRHSHRATRFQLLLNYWGRETLSALAPAECRPDALTNSIVIWLPWVARLRSVA